MNFGKLSKDTLNFNNNYKLTNLYYLFIQSICMKIKIQDI